LDAEWKGFVSSLSLPETKVGLNLEGEEIFHMSDPAGDDKGSGGYVYPENAKAIPGTFDLIDFRIGVDDEFVYFQLEFPDLTNAEIKSDEGFNGTLAAIIVDTDNVEKSGNNRLFYDNGNFLLSDKDAYEYVIEVSNAGVLLYDQDWVWQLLFLKALSEESHIQDNKFVFAIPQTIIGSPDSSWKIQVVTGGQWGGYKNTAYGVGSFMRAEKRANKNEEGGGTEDAFNPDIYDILVPEGLDQTKILGDYSKEEKKKVVIPLVSVRSIPTDEGIKGLINPLGVD
jgi:carbohydrate-binding DOMON domain-containing protein